LFAIAATKLGRDLGYGMPISSILSSVAFTICLFFYLYVVGSFFRITVYPLINRVTFYTVFQHYVINGYLDNIVAIVATTSWFLLSVNNRAIRYYFSLAYGGAGVILAVISPDNIIFDIITLLSLPLIIGVTLYYYYRRQKNHLNFNPKLTLRYISLPVIAISAICIVFHVSSAFITPRLDSSTVGSHANELFLLLSSFSPIYIVLLVFCLAVKVLFKGALGMLKLNVKEDISQTISDNYESNRGRRLRLKTQTKIGFLLLAMILSIVLVLIPQHPSINKDNQDIGVDTSYYVTWIGELAKSKSVSDLIYQAFIVQGNNGDRPLSLIFIFLVYQVVGGGNLSEVIEHLPILLGPGIVLAFYFLTLELTRNEKMALIAAFLGAVSLHTLAGIYAGFYANWLALIVGYVSLVFLFRYLRSGRLSDIVVFSTLLIGVLFFHVYTWTVLTAVAAVFLIAMLLIVIRKKEEEKNNNNNTDFTKRRIIWLLLAILLSIVVDVTKVLLTGSSGGLEQDIKLAQTRLGVEQFIMRWQILNITMNAGLGGVFSNFIILILGLLWVLKSNMRDPGTAFLMIFLSAGLVPLFFGSWAIQARVFYDMPLEIPAAIALYYISNRSGSILTALAACTWLVAISLFTVMNFYLIPVPGMR
jgi:heme/copper-type cytochrome/quinol oxidase subunit 2